MVNYNRSNSSVISGINIVPFTDIVLVLLVVFMIAAPGIVNSGLDINLPGASSSKSSQSDRTYISLDVQGNLYFNENKIEPESLQAMIAEKLEENPDAAFVLNADSSSLHGRVVDMLDILRSTGAKKIYVGTRKK